jgi:RNA polymerase primary sigma factor
MVPEETNMQLQHLVAMGKEKGFVTQDEVNVSMPSDIFAPKQIDDMLALLGDMNIEIVEHVPEQDVPQRPAPVGVGDDESGAPGEEAATAPR